MGLDCFLIKRSKKQLRKVYSALGNGIQATSLDAPETLMQLLVGQPINAWNAWHDEIAYYRGWHSLNSWMVELAKEKVPSIVETPECLSNRPLLLTKEDLERLKMEVVFGEVMDNCPFFNWRLFNVKSMYNTRIDEMNKFLEVIDRAIRICHCNRSLVFYVGIW